MAMVVCFQAFAQRKPKIKGNRSVVEVSEVLPPFTAIELIDDLDIVLKRSRQEGYDVTADDNLIDVLKFKVEGGTLYISSFYRITGKKKLEITINYVELTSVLIREGRIETTDNVSADTFDVNLYGSSKLDMGIDAGVINLNMEGNSSGDLHLKGDTLNIKLKDRIDVGLFLDSERASIEMVKNAAATIEGSTYALSAHLFDNTNLKARKLEAEGVELIAEGSPSARVYARTDFELTSSGSSKTYLSGTAKIDILEFLDTSVLHKEK